MLPRTAPCIFKVLPTIISIDDYKIRNTVSIDRATLVPSSNFAELQLKHTPDGPVTKREAGVDEAEGQVPPKNQLTRHANTQSIVLCARWAKAIAFDTSYTDIATNQRPIRSSRLSTFPITSLLAFAFKQGRTTKCDNDVDGYSPTEDRGYRR